MKQSPQSWSIDNRQEVELMAMQSVVDAERALGNQPKDVSAEKCGYDILSFDPKNVQRFIEVKGRAASADFVTVSANEIRACYNAKKFVLAIVQVENGLSHQPRYVWHPSILNGL